MTAAFDYSDDSDLKDLGLEQLVDLLTEAEKQALRPVVLRLVASHGRRIPDSADGTPRVRRLSFGGIAEAASDFAATSQEVLRRELGGH